MSNRTYTFTFEDGFMNVATTDSLLDDAQAMNILAWFATEIKPHAPLAALHELHNEVHRAILDARQADRQHPLGEEEQ